MSGRVDGKVALITGAARGQGRSHAVRLAQEGADIIALDLCAPIASVPYPLATQQDLEETVRLVESLGRRIVAHTADVRDLEAVRAVVDEGVAVLGRLDIVSANAGIATYGTTEDLDPGAWQDVIDVNLTGVWHTAKASIPHMKERGGSIVLTSSSGGLKGLANIPHYTAAKHGLVGLMRTMAIELAPHNVRVNSIHPCSVDTDMIQNEATHSLFAGDGGGEPSEQLLRDRFAAQNLLDVPWIDAVDISNALLFLASDEGRYITGVALPVDAGMIIK